MHKYKTETQHGNYLQTWFWCNCNLIIWCMQYKNVLNVGHNHLITCFIGKAKCNRIGQFITCGHLDVSPNTIKKWCWATESIFQSGLTRFCLLWNLIDFWLFIIFCFFKMQIKAVKVLTFYLWLIDVRNSNFHFWKLKLIIILTVYSCSQQMGFTSIFDDFFHATNEYKEAEKQNQVGEVLTGLSEIPLLWYIMKNLIQLILKIPHFENKIYS